MWLRRLPHKKMSEDKLKDLEELAGKMKEDFAEKAQQGDEHAAIRAGEMSLFEAWVEKIRNCDHTFVRKDDRRVCSKCGFEDPDSIPIEEKWRDAWL